MRHAIIAGKRCWWGNGEGEGERGRTGSTERGICNRHKTVALLLAAPRPSIPRPTDSTDRLPGCSAQLPELPPQLAAQFRGVQRPGVVPNAAGGTLTGSSSQTRLPGARHCRRSVLLPLPCCHCTRKEEGGAGGRASLKTGAVRADWAAGAGGAALWLQDVHMHDRQPHQTVPQGSCSFAACKRSRS